MGRRKATAQTELEGEDASTSNSRPRLALATTGRERWGAFGPPALSGHQRWGKVEPHEQRVSVLVIVTSCFYKCTASSLLAC